MTDFAAVSPVAVLAQLEAQAQAVSGNLPPDSAAEPDSLKYIGYRLTGYRLMTPMEQILEVIPYPDPSLVPGAQPWLKGITHVRGRLLPVVDLGRYLGSEPTPVRRSTRALVVERREVACALLVDEVFGVKRVASGAIGKTIDLDVPWLDGRVDESCFIDGDRWLTLDLQALFDEDAFISADA